MGMKSLFENFNECIIYEGIYVRRSRQSFAN